MRFLDEMLSRLFPQQRLSTRDGRLDDGKEEERESRVKPRVECVCVVADGGKLANSLLDQILVKFPGDTREKDPNY